jgi:hypothetical protein
LSDGRHVWTAALVALVALACGGTHVEPPIDDPGGGGASTSTTGGGGAGGHGGNGTGGEACSTPAECGAETTCATPRCIDGSCDVEHAPKGTVCAEDGGNVCSEGACVAWAALSTAGAPPARSQHTAVWNGSEMLVWGGRTGPGAETASGGRYDPVTDSWSAMSEVNAPVARHSHEALWTGTEMLVWGGFGGGASRADGGAYDPETDSWRTLASSGLFGRTNHVMKWSGTQMVVWGGRDGAAIRTDGATYDPALDQWQPLAPSPLGGRFNPAAAWALPGTNLPNGGLVIWGGSNFFDWLDDGATWDPVTNTWTSIGSETGAPPLSGAVPQHGLEGATSVWFDGGTAMYVWGGWDGGNHYGDGFFLDMHQQAGGYWYYLEQRPETPSPRRFHVSAPSTKTRGYLVWGGCADSTCSATLGDGGYWWQSSRPGGTWIYIPEDASLPPRSRTTIVNTGDEVIIWGGEDSAGETLSTGARRRMPDPP